LAKSSFSSADVEVNGIVMPLIDLDALANELLATPRDAVSTRHVNPPGAE
jgi:hypothetical protein